MSERIPLHHIAQKMYNQPLLITVDAAQVVNRVFSDIIATKAGWMAQSERADVQVFAPRKNEEDGTAIVYAPRASGFVGSTPRDPMTGKPAPYRVTADGTAIIRIVGELVNRGEWVDAESGLISYEGIKHQCATAAKDAIVKNVIIDMRTPGGEAEGCFDCAEEIRKLAAVNPVVCFVNGMACSAGYVLASACTRIVSIPEGRVGSIGVLMMHVDYSVALAMEGIKPTFLFAGTHKVDGNPFAPLPVDVQARFQAQIDQTYGMFIESVMTGRPKLTEQAIRDTGALVYAGKDALAIGLIDSIGTFDDLLADMAQPDSITVDVNDGDDGDGDEQPPPDDSKTQTQGAASPADTQSLADATAATDTEEDMDIKKIMTSVATALMLVEKEEAAGSGAAASADAGAPATPPASAETQTPPATAKPPANEGAPTTMIAGASLFTPKHYSAKAGNSESPTCGAPASEKSVTAIADVTCSDCLRLGWSRREDEAAAALAAEQAKALLGVEAAADAFVIAKCANLGKEPTAAYRARYVAAAKVNDTAAIADLETMAASVGPRRVERVDTKDAPNEIAVAGVLTNGNLHDDTMARLKDLGIQQSDGQKFSDAYYKERAAIMKKSGVKNVATA